MAATDTQATSKVARTCELLRQDILRGIFQPGTMLPPQRELSRRYRVAQGTASAAIGRLVHEGLAVTVHGRGSFVSEELPRQNQILDFVRPMHPSYSQVENDANILNWIDQFNYVAKQQGWLPRFHRLAVEETESVDRIAERFAESKGVVFFNYRSTVLPSLLRRKGLPVVGVCLMVGGLGEKAECFP